MLNKQIVTLMHNLKPYHVALRITLNWVLSHIPEQI
jgi:hypothetical protein